MAVLLEPKQDFIRDVLAREKHALIVHDPFIHRTFAIAIAEMHARGLAPTDMAGVNGFIFTWLNLSESNPEPRQMPNRHLKSFDGPKTTTTPPTQ